MKFTEKIKRGMIFLQKRPWKDCNPLQSGPWPRVRGGRGFDRLIPARGVAGGEGQGAREVEGVEANLLVGLGAGNGGRRRFVGVGAEHGGEGTRRRRALVRDRR